MANKEQLRILERGVEVWNKWRKNHPHIKINLRGANLSRQNLKGADFSEADIRSANLTGANLRGANFSGAKCGLQRRWVALLVILSWLLAGISGLSSVLATVLVLVIIDYDLSIQITGLVSLIVLFGFWILIIRQGIRAGGVAYAVAVAVAIAIAVPVEVAGATVFGRAIAVAFAVVIAGAIAIAVAIAVAVGVAVVVAITGAVTGAVTGAGAVAVAVVGAGLVVFTLAEPGVFAYGLVYEVVFPLTGAVTGAVTVAGAVAGAYVGWRALREEDERDAWVRSFAIAFAAKGGTSFRGAKLTEANFTGTRLKSTDLRKADLTGVRWYGAKMLDRVRPGDTYLKDAQVRQWLIGKGTNKNFNGKDLRGINLQGANLTDACFIATDLGEANLSGANLSGACIKDWVINSQTIIDDVICDYVYLKEGQQERIPHDPNRNFEPGEFAKYIETALNTVDLIFTDGIDWKAFLLSLEELQNEYGKENVGVQAIERKSGGVFVVRIEVPTDANKAEIEGHAKELYETKLQVLEAQYREELKSLESHHKDEIITLRKEHNTHLLELAKLAASRPITVEAKAVAENQSKNVEVEMNFQAPVTGAAGKVEGNQNIYVSEQKQTLAQAAEEIQNLLKQLEKTNPTATVEQQKAYVDAAISPSIKQRCVGALKAGGETAIEEFLDNPYVNVGKAVVKGWMKPE